MLTRFDLPDPLGPMTTVVSPVAKENPRPLVPPANESIPVAPIRVILKS